jgi:hypothetical protein
MTVSEPRVSLASVSRDSVFAAGLAMYSVLGE